MYVREQSREILFEISQKTVPKGVISSAFIMGFPLAFVTFNLAAWAPFAMNPEIVNPEYF